MQHSIRGNQYVKNYEFEFNFGAPWGNCSVTMTSVIGHLTGLEFERQYKGWQSCPPGSLFEAPVKEEVDKVCMHVPSLPMLAKNRPRINCPLLKIFETKRNTARLCLSGPIVIVRASI